MDIDLEAAAIRAGSTSSQYDLNNDGLVNAADLNHLTGSLVDINGGGVGGAHGTHPGDADLNGAVGASDLSAVLQHLGTAGSGAIWASGNFYNPNDTTVGASDLSTVLQNLGATGGTGALAAVPEPATCVLFGLGALSMVGFARRRSR